MLSAETLHKLPRVLRRGRALLFGHGMRVQGAGNPRLAVFYMCVAATTFTLMVALVRLASEELPPQQIFFLRMLFGFFFLLPWALRHEGVVRRPRRPWLMFFRAALGVSAGLLYFFSLALLPLAQAVSLNFTVPLFTAIFALLFLGERFRWRRFWALVFGFFGVVVIAQPWGGEIVPEMALPVISAALFAGATILIKKMSAYDPPGKILFWHHCWGCLLIAPLAFWVWQASISLTAWCALVFAAFFGTIGALAGTRAVRAAEVSFVMMFDYLRLPLTAFAAWLFFAESTEPATWAGAVMIFAATWYVVRRELIVRGRITSATPQGRH